VTTKKTVCATQVRGAVRVIPVSVAKISVNDAETVFSETK